MQGIGIKDNSKHQIVPALLEALLNLEWNVVDDAKKFTSNKTRRVIRKPSLQGRQRDGSFLIVRLCLAAAGETC